MALRTRSSRTDRAATRRNVTAPPPPEPKQPSQLAEKVGQFSSYFHSTPFLMRAAWLAVLTMIYVGIQNYYDRLTYDIARTKKEMDEVKAVYISRNSEYMFESKQSEIARRLSSHGLDKNIVPPVKIQVETPE